MKHHIKILAIAAAAGSLGCPAYGQDFPINPIRLVSPTAGGAIDVAARIISPHVAAHLGQQLVIDNRGGAGGLIAVETVIRARPDGYTLLYYGPPAWLNPLLKKSISYDPIKDLLPISLITRTANLLVVHASLPAKTVKELIDLAKSKPDQLLDAGSDTGSSAHMAAELFKHMAGVSIRRVPYKGVGAGVIGLLTGEAQLMIPAISAAMPHVQSGRLRALGVSTAEPTMLAPGVPTITSSGLTGFVAESPNALFAPVGTPQAIIAKVNLAVNRALSTQEVREKLLVAGSEATGGTPEIAAQVIRSDMTKWAKVIKELRMREE